MLTIADASRAARLSGGPPVSCAQHSEQRNGACRYCVLPWAPPFSPSCTPQRVPRRRCGCGSPGACGLGSEGSSAARNLRAGRPDRTGERPSGLPGAHDRTPRAVFLILASLRRAAAPGGVHPRAPALPRPTALCLHGRHTLRAALTPLSGALHGVAINIWAFSPFPERCPSPMTASTSPNHGNSRFERFNARSADEYRRAWPQRSRPDRLWT